MIKKLTKHGNSHAIIIDRTMMEQLGITPDTPLHMLITGESITIRPANVGIPREELDQAMNEVERDFGDALKRLAQ